MMPIQEKCRVIDHRQVGPRHYKLVLQSTYISSHAQPGQFVNVRCSEKLDPLLRRPLSLHRISVEHQTFELLYEVVGRGTECLAAVSVGAEIDILGPLGRGFRVDPKKSIHIIVGGGMGVAPLAALGEEIGRKCKNAFYVLIGAKSRDRVIGEEEFRKITDQVLVATDDGSYGKKGFISDLLLDFLNNQLTTYNSLLTTIYACGPKPMLRAVAEIAFQKQIDCQISMEERMACAVGACKGCATKTRTGYQMVCQDGPVFNAGDIVWQ